MKEISSLMGYRKEIKLLDATLRDGGLVNDFYFTDEFAKALYETNLKAGVDIMEFGYKADKDLFDEDKFGKWKFCKDEDIRAIVGEGDPRMQISVMADVGRCNYHDDIIPKDESPIDIIRVATYLHTIPAAIDMIEDAAKKGYKTTCNIMAVSTGRESSVVTALDMIGQSPVDVIYIVDSYGSMYPEELQRLAAVFMEAADKYGKTIGIHAHNNQQLAFANTIEAIGDGANWADATYSGMGRGAGNCYMECMLGFLNNPKYKIFPAVRFIDKYIRELKENGVVWGYDTQYLFTGLYNQHPRSAIAYTHKGRTDLTEYYKEVMTED